MMPTSHRIRSIRVDGGFLNGTVDHLPDLLGYKSRTDVATQARLAEDLASILEPVPESTTAGDWAPVYGELLTSDDPEYRLPAIDRLEGFRPDCPSLYRRVLVPVCIDHDIVLPEWVYVAGRSLERSAL